MRVKFGDLTKYEKARLIGARALQLSMGAPPLIKVPKGTIGAVSLAKAEFDRKVIPLQVIRAS
ncbi:DNA-directed RNA polymerase subunit K [Candidatus Micrarchaeota archaeon]|nr:DNA-directed RNA polymerase subunit K [Candidatus Micrarchaeota archaeon]